MICKVVSDLNEGLVQAERSKATDINFCWEYWESFSKIF